MSDTNPVNWFEIPVNDLDRAKKFYSGAFGIDMSDDMEMGPSKMSFFPGGSGKHGATGTLIKAEGYTPSHVGSVIYMHVPDIEGTLSKINANGGKTLVPKQSIGEHGFIAHFEDTEGNRVALHQAP